MLGNYFNAVAILLGGIAGLLTRKNLPPATQNFVKLALGALTFFFGVKLVWDNISGKFLGCVRQFVIVLLALMVGRLLGKLLRLQRVSNRAGQYARARIAATGSGKTSWSDGFNTSVALFCAAPLAFLGAVQGGLLEQGGSVSPFVVKAVMDGLAAAGFAVMFGWGAVAAVVPVFVFQGTLILLCERFAAPWLVQHQLVGPVGATCGLLMLFIGLVIFEARKIELADYLPALAVAPAIAYFWH